MTASTVARTVRISMLAAVVASALAACSNDPTSPVAPQRSVRNSVNVAPGGASATTGDATTPWYRNTQVSPTNSTPADATTPWYRNGTTPPAAATPRDATTPWY